jgi:hypothetical protein
MLWANVVPDAERLALEFVPRGMGSTVSPGSILVPGNGWDRYRLGSQANYGDYVRHGFGPAEHRRGGRRRHRLPRPAARPLGKWPERSGRRSGVTLPTGGPAPVLKTPNGTAPFADGLGDRMMQISLSHLVQNCCQRQSASRRTRATAALGRTEQLLRRADVCSAHGGRSGEAVHFSNPDINISLPYSRSGCKEGIDVSFKWPPPKIRNRLSSIDPSAI